MNEKRKYFTHSPLESTEVVSHVVNIHSHLTDYSDYFRFAVTRDPVKRFLSLYAGRVVRQRDLSNNYEVKSAIAILELHPEPSLNEFVGNFEKYCKASRSIHHHSRPQIQSLGPDITVFTRLVDINMSNEIVSDIFKYWEKLGRNDLLAQAPSNLINTNSTSEIKLPLNALTQDSFEQLLDYYSEDYINIPTISLASIKDEYHKASKEGLFLGG